MRNARLADHTGAVGRAAAAHSALRHAAVISAGGGVREARSTRARLHSQVHCTTTIAHDRSHIAIHDSIHVLNLYVIFISSLISTS